MQEKDETNNTISAIAQTMLPMGMTTLFGFGLFLIVIAPLFAHEAIRNVVAIGILGVWALFIAGYLFFARDVILPAVTRFDISIVSTTVLLLLYVYALTPLDQSHIFGFSFQQTTLIAFTAYAVIFLCGYVIERFLPHSRKYALRGIQWGISSGLLVLLIYWMHAPQGVFLRGVDPFSVALLGSVALIIASVASMEKERTFYIRVLNLVCIFIGVLTILLVRSDQLLVATGVAALIAVGIQMLARLRYRRKRSLQKAVNTFVVIGALLLLIGVGTIHAYKLIPFNMPAVPQVTRPSFSATVHVGLSAFARQPVQALSIGTGVRSFYTDWNKFMPDASAQSRFWNTDFKYGFNLVLTLLIELGLPIFLLINIGIPFFIFSFLYTNSGLSVAHIILAFFFYWIWILVPETFFILIALFFFSFTVGRVPWVRTSIVSRKSARVFSIVVAILLVVSGGSFIWYAGLHARALSSYGEAIQSTVDNKKNVSTHTVALLLQSIQYVKNAKVLMAAAVAESRLVAAQQKLPEKQRRNPLILMKSAVAHAQEAVEADHSNYRAHITLTELQLQNAVLTQDTSKVNNILKGYADVITMAPQRILPQFLYIRALIEMGRLKEANSRLVVLTQRYPKFLPLSKLRTELNKKTSVHKP